MDTPPQNGTVTSLPVFIQNIFNCVPKTNKAFMGSKDMGVSEKDKTFILRWSILLSQIGKKQNIYIKKNVLLHVRTRT